MLWNYVVDRQKTSKPVERLNSKGKTAQKASLENDSKFSSTDSPGTAEIKQLFLDKEVNDFISKPSNTSSVSTAIFKFF